MERMVKVNFNTFKVTIKDATNGTVLKDFSQDRQPKETKVISDFIRGNKGKYVPVIAEITKSTTAREMPLSVFVANSKEVAPDVEAPTETATE